MNQMQWELQQTRERLEVVQYQIKETLNTGHIQETAFGRTVLNQQVNDIAEFIEKLATRKTKGIGGAYNNALVKGATELNRNKDYVQNFQKVAYLGLLHTLNCVYDAKREHSYAQHIAYEIGKAIEEEQNLYMFKEVHADLAFTLEHHTNRTVYAQDQKHMINVYKMKQRWEDKNIEEWGKKTRIHVGMRVLRAILTVMKEYFVLKKVFTAEKHNQVVKTTPELETFREQHTEYVLRTTVTSQPCIEPPISWVVQGKHIIGGFHSIDMSANRPFIKTKIPEQREWIAKHPPLKHIETANGLQRVAWTVNTAVLELLKVAMKTGIFPEHIPSLTPYEFPPKPTDPAAYYPWKKDRFGLVKLEKERKLKLTLLQTVISMAHKLMGKPFWFVVTADFRGRFYCSSGTLNTQGEPYVRALLQFDKGKQLGKPGLYWLAIHGANTYGYTAHSFDDRYQWVMDNMASIRCVAQEPDSSRGRSFLNSAKDPFGFYAFAREWTEAHYLDNPASFVSHLPVMFDGSANGLQHYSAMLRDQRGAEKTNLTLSNAPKDIYRSISNRTQQIFTEDTHSTVAWIARKGGIDRDLVKVPVMAVPYGITIRGISLKICHYIDDNAAKYDLQEGDLKNWNVVTYITEKVIEVINEEVPAPKKVMEWLQTISRDVVKEGNQVKWISPVGFPVCQPYIRYQESTVSTNLLGTKKLVYKDKPIGINSIKSRAALPANFIHSLDSSHLVLTLYKLYEQGITDVTCIHDSIGTHAADAGACLDAIKVGMYDLYRRDILREFRQQMLVLTPRVDAYPVQGEYDIQDVLTAKYFFN